MSTVDASSETTTTSDVGVMDMKLDADFTAEDGLRVVQVTPPGSHCSVIFGAGITSAGTDGRVPGPDPKRGSYGSFASFSDPDGNGWVLQEITTRLPGR